MPRDLKKYAREDSAPSAPLGRSLLTLARRDFLARLIASQGRRARSEPVRSTGSSFRQTCLIKKGTQSGALFY
jgi:hypothetical protein